MFLALDVGNTNAVVGLFQQEHLLATWRLSTHPLVTADELRLKLHHLLTMEGYSLEDIQTVSVSSVVPQLNSAIEQAFKKIKPQFIDHNSPLSFEILADPKSQVGADRLVNAEAAIQYYGAPCIVLDSGTATTICAINERKQYLGGAIMPGLELSMRALAQNTAKLFNVTLTAPTHAIGSNTQDAIRSGIVLGYACMIEGLVNRFIKEMAPSNKVTVIATGGVSYVLKDLIPGIDIVDTNLTLKGIEYINRSSSYASTRY